ncbi:protein kinase domain-containing protein [Tautonia sociabilis]|uniref:Serine/threonine-protein kinase n=1 Tax=Tautonia sociabilis TaxID=2080755 RepID=A0A432MRC4_9BACT|nr:serine/threonine-protein kinase [Tautonia sociabilis]RUL89567.1 serine/threonine-protein kinase [Tautonia sociabilis]
MAGLRAQERLDRGSVASSFPTSEDDPRLIRALEDYLEAVEAGKAPSRDAYLEAHPEIASRLAGCLEGMEVIHEVIGKVGTGGGSSETMDGPIAMEEPPAGVLLGEYRLGRELGRGGMGIVYEAWQQSLGRRVAVKVLPFAATLDPRQLRRFKTEAQAAAYLQHEHIVPVYAFGTDRGTHYYAMRLIEGCSLASLIGRWRNDPRIDDRPAEMDEAIPVDPTDMGPFSDFVASVGIQAAEALEHAHSLGVLHRDIKPGNLLVDGSGHLWVTDFGLARIQATTSLTRSGDLLGTLRYMSPEQAKGRHSSVDHRADVYGLGATLYELLTRRPLFEGGDPSVLVEKIQRESPQAPRKLDPSIPRDLETIILKALAKEPGDRYGSAAELAEDLRRFRDDRPIRARRPSPSERLTRWARRHKPAVLTAGVLMVLALLAQSATIMLLALESRRARENAARASATSLRLYDMADDLYDQVAEGIGPNSEEAEARRRLLETALGIYERFAEEAEDDPSLAPRTAIALRKAGDIHARLGHRGEAAACYRRALARYRSPGDGRTTLGDDRPAEVAYVLNRLGTLLLVAGDRKNAIGLLEEAVVEQERQVARQGSAADRLTLIAYLIDLGRPVPDQQVSERSSRALARALALADELAHRSRIAPVPPGTIEQAEALKRLIQGKLERNDRRFADAIASDRSALDCYRQLVTAHPDRLEFQERASAAAMSLAWSLASCPDPSVRDESQAIALVTSTLEEDKGNPDLMVHAGVFLIQIDRHEQAERLFRKVLEVTPDRADVVNNLAWLLATSPDPSRRDPDEAIRLAERAIALDPTVASYWNTLGVAYYRAGRLKDALASLQTSMDLSDGGNGFDWFVLAMTLWKLGDRDAAELHYARAVNWMRLLPQSDSALKEFREEADSTVRA